MNIYFRIEKNYPNYKLFITNMFKKHNLGLFIKRIGIFKTKRYIFTKIIKRKIKNEKEDFKRYFINYIRNLRD